METKQQLIIPITNHKKIKYNKPGKQNKPFINFYLIIILIAFYNSLSLFIGH